MSDREHAAALFAMAKRDLRALAGMMDSTTFADAIFGFHAQQTIEKCLKAMLSSGGVRYPRTHDLETLAGLLREQGQVLPDVIRELIDLTDFAVQFRYEAWEETVERPLDRLELVRSITTLVEHVERLLADT